MEGRTELLYKDRRVIKANEKHVCDLLYINGKFFIEVKKNGRVSLIDWEALETEVNKNKMAVVAASS